MVYSTMELEFEWDAFKERENIKKHAVTFIEAIESFFDAAGFQMTVTVHSAQERRYYLDWQNSGWKGFNNALHS